MQHANAILFQRTVTLTLTTLLRPESLQIFVKNRMVHGQLAALLQFKSTKEPSFNSAYM